MFKYTGVDVYAGIMLAYLQMCEDVTVLKQEAYTKLKKLWIKIFSYLMYMLIDKRIIPC